MLDTIAIDQLVVRAATCMASGDYDRARLLFRRAFELTRKALKPEVAAATNPLARTVPLPRQQSKASLELADIRHQCLPPAQVRRPQVASAQHLCQRQDRKRCRSVEPPIVARGRRSTG